MKLLLILLGIYVYFVVGNLVCNMYMFLGDKNVIIPGDREYYNNATTPIKLWLVSIFPVLLILLPIFAIHHNRDRILRALPIPNIPFTPKKVADLICKIDLKKLVKYRIRIEPKSVGTPEKLEKPEVDYMVGEEVSVTNNKVVKVVSTSKDRVFCDDCTSYLRKNVKRSK